MDLIDWRELYASNRAAIERATGKPVATATLPMPSPLPAKPAAPPMSLAPATNLASVLGAALPTSLPARPNTAPGVASTLSDALGRRVPPRRASAAATRQGGALVHLPAGVDRGTAGALLSLPPRGTPDPHPFAAPAAVNRAAVRPPVPGVFPPPEPGRQPPRCC